MLLINTSNELAWVLRTGGIGNHIREVSGPWSTDSDVIKKLLAAMKIDQNAVADCINLPGPASTNNADSGTADSTGRRAD